MLNATCHPPIESMTTYSRGLAPHVAFTAPMRLRNAITKVCSVRTHSLGAVTIFLRQSNVVDAVEAIVNRKVSKEKKSQESARLQAERLQNFDIASETVLAQTVDELQTQIRVTSLQSYNPSTTQP